MINIIIYGTLILSENRILPKLFLNRSPWRELKLFAIAVDFSKERIPLGPMQSAWKSQLKVLNGIPGLGLKSIGI